MIADQLRERGWSEAHLASRPKGDSFKVLMAGRLRAETAVTLAWIAQRLHMGARGNLTYLLQHRERPARSDSAQNQLPL